MSGDNNAGNMYTVLVYIAQDNGEPAYVTFAHNPDGSIRMFTELEPAENYAAQITHSQVVKFVEVM